MAQALVLLLLISGVSAANQGMESPWPITGGDAGGSRYSHLSEINRDTVSRLKVAWTYRHGDFRSASGPLRFFKGTAFEATPIVVEGGLVFTTPFNRVIALDPGTGRELWTFDPKIDLGRRYGNMMINRGVAYWRDPSAAGEACSSRVFLGTLDSRLIALDLHTGKPCERFGKAGAVNLLEGVSPIADPWEYNVTSPPTVVADRVIVGSSIADITRRIQPSGAVRAFDPRSGALVWKFDTIPRAGEFGSETWQNDSWRHSGGANVWTTMTVDLERGWVFLPVSSAGPDFYGGDRGGSNLFSDALVALDARTGKRIWHFQTVHHDLWDYDLAAPANLIRIRREGRTIDAVAQATKNGFVFVLDRETGKPLFPVEEKPVPQSDVRGEQTWPTQPVPLSPPRLVPQLLRRDDLWRRDQKHYQQCSAWLDRLRNEGLFTPPSERGSILYPYAAGGANWSGAAWDEKAGVLFVPVNNLANVIQLKKLPDSNFHQTDGIVMHNGMSAIWWVLTGRGTGLRYQMNRELFGIDGKPCNQPPWGLLAAVDLNSGNIIWQMPVGEENGVSGLPNFGPPLATAGGVVFHAGSRDLRLRAHDSRTGEVLATFQLPAGLHAGPITYLAGPNKKQHLVIAPGGHIGLGSTLGDYVMAYALPD